MSLLLLVPDCSAAAFCLSALSFTWLYHTTPLQPHKHTHTAQGCHPLANSSANRCMCQPCQYDMQYTAVKAGLKNRKHHKLTLHTPFLSHVQAWMFLHHPSLDADKMTIHPDQQPTCSRRRSQTGW
jgi:hypothetical protein